MRTGAAFILLALAAIAPRIAHADYGGTDAYEEFGKHVREAEEVAPLKSSVFGEQVSLYRGSAPISRTVELRP